MPNTGMGNLIRDNMSKWEHHPLESNPRIPLMQREHPTKHHILHAKLTWNKNIILHTRESELYILTRLISLKDDFMSLFILMFSNETIHAILQN